MQRTGPGIWLSCHSLAKEFRNQPDIFWKAFTRILLDNLNCPKCHLDTEEYIRTHPEERYDPVTWLWRFHHHVNLKLGKQVVPHPDSDANGDWKEEIPQARREDTPLILSGYYI